MNHNNELWFKGVKDHSNFWDGNRAAESRPLSTKRSRSVPFAATRFRVRCPYPTKIYFRHLRANPRRLIFWFDIHVLSVLLSLSVCHLTPVAYTRDPLSAFGAPRFSVPRQIGNYPLARAVAARLRLIDFFDKRGSHRDHGRPALPFSDETHDRDREKRDARGER